MLRGYATLLCVLLVACQTEHWEAGEGARAPDEDVAAALGDTTHQNEHGLRAEDIPEIGYPHALRPCCAFGADLRVAAGAVPIPGVELGNLVPPSEVGPHRYDNGYLSISGIDPRGAVDVENNGLVYTCRGGFIDLAHVRDNADNTLGLSAWVGRTMDTGGSIELPTQGAFVRVHLRPVGADAIRKYGRMKLAVAAAQWLAFQVSIWHEISTFYGYSAIAAWPEKVSAFSPEDLYSNQIGVRIAGGVILGRGARSDVAYDYNVDAWIERTLERLGAVSLADSHAAMRAVDGAWWDSEKRIPDWTLVKRRRFDSGPLLAPWRLEDATPPLEPLAACRDAAPPLVLHVVDGFAGARFRDYAAIEFEVSDALAAAGFPFPSAASRVVTQEDFPFVIERIHAANAGAFGPGADAP